MSVSYIITAELLSRFKEPFGLLIEGPPSETGTNTTVGEATAYETELQGRLIEPSYIIKRNNPQEKPKGEEAK